MSEVKSQERANTPRSRRQTLAGALLVALIALFFLRDPIAKVNEGVLGPDDCSQGFALLRVDPEAKPANPELARTWATHQTWPRLSAERLLGGGLPVWNGFNGGGLPHLANPQAAVFSPFSWSFYVFDPAWAALIAAFAKLFVAGFFTFLFLREIGLAFSAGILGAVVFMFSGAEITTLLAPQSSTVVLLPAGLFLAERITQIVEETIRAGGDERKRLLRPALAFVLVISASFFGGALDTFVFCGLAVAAWIAVRFLLLLKRAGFERGARREIALAVALLAGVALTAACVCAIQALPYLEYLREARGAPPAGVEFTPPSWPLLFFPGLFGHPGSGAWFGPGFGKPDFALLASSATGALPLMLAIFGFSATSRGRAGWFFAAVGLAGLFLGSGALGNDLFDGLFPLQEEPEVGRALVLFPFSIAVLAALAVDRVARGGPFASPAGALGTFAAAAAVVLFARGVAQQSLDAALADPRVVDQRGLLGLSSSAHLEFAVATFLVGVGLFALASVMHRTRTRALVILALTPVVYAHAGAALEDFNPVTPNRLVLPRTPDLDRRDGLAGIRGSLVLGDVDVPAAVNALYGMRSLAVNDPLHVRRFDQLHETLFAPRGAFGVVTHTSRRALELFGVEKVFDTDGWVEVDTEFGGRPSQPANRRETAEITAQEGVSQYFTAPADGLQALRFFWITKGVPNARAFDVTVDDLDTGTRLVGIVVTPWAVRPAGRDVVDCVVPFPSGTPIKGHALLLRVTTKDESTAGGSYAILCRTDLPDLGPTWRATQGERVLEGQLDLDLSYSFDAFHFEDRVGPFAVYRFDGATTRFRTLGSSRVVNDDGAAWKAVLDPAFEAASEVVLEGAPAGLARRGTRADEAGAEVEVLDDLDGHVRLIVKRQTEGFVVTPIAWYPGWKAKVNSAPARTLCANYAFTAVPVPAGESLVELEFAPKSVRNGLLLSIAGLLALLVAFAFTLPPEQRA